LSSRSISAGAAYGFFDIETGTEMGFLYGYGYGLYLTLVGGVLALTGGLGPLKW
jgi:hypothetical protein